MRLTLGSLFCLPLAACTGAIDGGDPDPNGTAVEIVVRDGQIPQAGIQVIFQATDDSVVAELVTDLEGRAVADLAGGGSVTVIRTFPAGPLPEDTRPAEIYTYVGISPGDRLELGKQLGDGTPSAINVHIPEGLNNVRITTPCGSGQGSAPIVPITVTGCAGMIPFYVSDGGGAFVKAMPVSENVDLSGEALLGNLASTIGVTNHVPNSTVSAEVQLELAGFEIYSSGAKRVDQNPATYDLPNLLGVEQLVIAQISIDGKTQRVAHRAAFDNAITSVDGSIGLIPYPANVVYAPTGISWAEEGPAREAAEAVLVRLDVTRDVPGGQPGPADEYVRWIVAPHAGFSVLLPQLPGAHAVYNPRAVDRVAGTTGLVKVTGGYDAVRSRVFAVDDIADLAPADGQAVLSYRGTRPSL
jgi:hypothetical protein